MLSGGWNEHPAADAAIARPALPVRLRVAGRLHGAREKPLRRQACAGVVLGSRRPRADSRRSGRLAARLAAGGCGGGDALRHRLREVRAGHLVQRRPGHAYRLQARLARDRGDRVMSNIAIEDELLDVTDVQAILGCSLSYAYQRMRHWPPGFTVRLGRKIVVRKARLMGWLEEGGGGFFCCFFKKSNPKNC